MTIGHFMAALQVTGGHLSSGASCGECASLRTLSWLLEPVHDLFTPSLGRKRVKDKAGDAGNNRLLPRSPTQYMTLFRSSPTGSGSAPVSVPGIAGSDRRYKPLSGTARNDGAKRS